jgi:glycerol-3-phosphate acyltransferase PlsY
MLFAVAPVPMALALALFVIAVTLTGRISVGSLGAAICVPALIGTLKTATGGRYPLLLVGLTATLALFIVWTHRGNIRRLLNGEERRFPQLQLWRRWFG